MPLRKKKTKPFLKAILEFGQHKMVHHTKCLNIKKQREGSALFEMASFNVLTSQHNIILSGPEQKNSLQKIIKKDE